MDKTIINSILSDVTHGRGYVYCLQFHIVFVTKYRKQIFQQELADEVTQYLKTTCKKLDIEIVAMEVMPDHVHMLVSCKPQIRLSDTIKILKGNTARWLFLQHPEIKNTLWGGHLWNPSYFVASVSERSFEKVEQYIHSQKAKK